MAIRIGFNDSFGNAAYLYQDRSGGWHAASRNGTPQSFSNYADDAMKLRFALEDAGDDPQAALAAFKDHAQKAPAATATLV